MDRTAALTLVLLLGLCVGSPHQGRRLLCWKAVLRCHAEPDCRYAYDQHLYACAAVLSGGRRTCPSHCVSSLVQLNRTQSGPALEDCDCALDPVCRRTRQAIEPCLPRTRTLGCTEARRQCETDPSCSSAMNEYLFHCRRLFGGESCSRDCRAVIARMRSAPKARQLDTCVCDGADRTICEHIKLSMKTFCSRSGSGSGREPPPAGPDPDSDSEEDDDVEQEDYDVEQDYLDAESSGDPTLRRDALHVLTTILVLAKFL